MGISGKKESKMILQEKKIVSVRQVVIDEDRTGQRLDNFLKSQLRGAPFSLVQRIIRTGEVRVNKGRTRAGYRLMAGDIIRIPPVRLAEVGCVPPPSKNLIKVLEQSIIFEDERLIVLNKPSGIAVHGGSGISQGVIEMLRVMRANCPGLELVHRIDRDTSGCLMIAKKRSMLRYLHERMRSGELAKRYQLIVAGQWSSKCREVSKPLLKNILQSGERIVVVHTEGKPSRTNFKVLQRFEVCTLLEAILETGRTHQIRVHAQHSGHSILGDEKYGSPESAEISRQLYVHQLCLHACELAFWLPEKQHVSFKAPLPEAFTKVMKNVTS